MEKLNKIMVLDDDPMVATIIEHATKVETLSFDSSDELLGALDKYEPAAFFIDIKVGANENGLHVIPELRMRFQAIPVIVITGAPLNETIRDALASGADDFICKPLQPKELIARLQPRLEDLAKKAAKQVLEIGDIRLDVVHRTLFGASKQTFLSPIECTLLATLINAKETVVEKDTLKLRCWGQFKVTDNALHRKLHSVRHAMRDVTENVAITTKYGVGFSIESSSPKSEGHLVV